MKMSQKDSEEDIDKAYNLFVDQEQNVITFASLKRIVEDLSIFFILDEELTDQQIMQLIKGANNKDFEIEEKQDKKNKDDRKSILDLTVTKEQFIKILSSDYQNEQKKK